MQVSQQILIIGKVWPEPTSSAAGTRMMQLIHHFIEKGDHLTFVSSAKESVYQEDLSQLTINCAQVKLNDSSFNEFVKELNPHIVIFDRFMTEEQFGWRVMDSCPSALRIVNTEDVHFLRDARRKALNQNRVDGISGCELNLDFVHFRSDLQLRELASIYRSDLSFLVSDFEVKLLKETYSIPEEKLVYLPLHAEKCEIQPSFEVRENFVFIGNFWHEPNWDAVRYLKSIIWPLLRKKVPKAKLLIYGAYCSEKVFQLTNEQEGFLVKGRADDALEVVSQGRVSLAPLRFGAGIKGKLLESMACGTPSVTTTIGAEGMTDGTWGGFIEDQPEQFANQAARLYTDQHQWKAAQKCGFDLLQERFSKAAFAERLDGAIRQVSDLERHRSKSLISLILQKESHQAARYLSIWIEEKKRNGRGGS